MKNLIDGWEITSNMRPIRLMTWNELRKKEQEDFNHVAEHDKDDPVFFRAYGSINTVSDFMRLSEPVGPWIASHPESMSTALFLMINDYQDVIVGYGIHRG